MPNDSIHVQDKANRTTRVKKEHQIFAPGARIVVRDAEWLIRRVDRTSTGGQALSATGISELVRDKESIFLTEIEGDIEILDPIHPVPIRHYPEVPGSGPSFTWPPSTAAIGNRTMRRPGPNLENDCKPRISRMTRICWPRRAPALLVNNSSLYGNYLIDNPLGTD
jgi:hypothetical protein